jgi:hypothetical protein
MSQHRNYQNIGVVKNKGGDQDLNNLLKSLCFFSFNSQPISILVGLFCVTGYCVLCVGVLQSITSDPEMSYCVIDTLVLTFNFHVILTIFYAVDTSLVKAQACYWCSLLHCVDTVV